MAAPSDQRVAVPIDDPNADTEWYVRSAAAPLHPQLTYSSAPHRNDILRKHGIIPEKPPSPTPLIEEALMEARQLAHANRLEGKDLDELAELEDDEDEGILEVYRRRRMAELASLQKASLHGSVYPVSKPEYAREVTEASEHGPVLVNLTSAAANAESRVLSALWRDAAREYGEVKFCEMRADRAIEGYPERNCPTILVYSKGDIVKQVVTLLTMGGARGCDMGKIDDLLVEVGAVKDSDIRVAKRRREALERDEEEGGKQRSSIRTAPRKAAAEDDDDWD